jgi:hypothetical protein
LFDSSSARRRNRQRIASAGSQTHARRVANEDVKPAEGLAIWARAWVDARAVILTFNHGGGCRNQPKLRATIQGPARLLSWWRS